MKHSPQLVKRLKMPAPTPTTAFGERLLRHEGPEGLSMMLSFQQTFGAKVLHYQDAEGEVGTRPSWATDEDTP
jgi:hypothetical protein